MVGLYCRVSTDEQAQQGFSIESQKERLIAYCKSQGWEEYRLYIDDGFTGTNMERPALQRMISHIHDGKLSKVVVYKLDRLGRKQKDVLHMLEDVFEKNNVTFKSSSEPFDTSTSLGKAMLGILAVFAQLERDTIIERTTIGRRQRIKKGLWYGGREPFGYRWNKDAQTLEVIPEQASIVEEIFSRFLQGQSFLSISDWANARTQERLFNHAAIREMIKRPIYIGCMNVDGELVRGNHVPIINIDRWEMAQDEMQKRIDGRPIIGQYLLSGLLQCGVCNGPVIHVHTTRKRNGKVSKYEYYTCKAQHVRPANGNNICSLGYKKKEELEQWVITKLKQLSINSEDVAAEINASKKNDAGNQRLLTDLRSKLSSIDTKLDRWYSAFEEGALNPSQLRERIDSLESEKKSLFSRIEEIEANLKIDRSEYLFQSLDLVGQAWDYLNFDEQQTVLRTAITKIIVNKEGDPTFVWNS